MNCPERGATDENSRSPISAAIKVSVTETSTKIMFISRLRIRHSLEAIDSLGCEGKKSGLFEETVSFFSSSEQRF